MAAKRGDQGAVKGRRPKPPDEKMRNRVGVAFTDKEIERLRSATRGEHLATFIRELVLRFLEKGRRGR